MKIRKLDKNEKGVTLIALIITIIILMIIAGISIYNGRDVLKNAKLEELRTNMLLIQAKSKEYIEQATFQMGINSDDSKKAEVRQEVYVNDAGLEKADSVPSQFKISDTSTCYWLTEAAQQKWGLEEIKLEDQEKYLIQFDEENQIVEVYNTLGYDEKYSLTEINEIKLNK